MVEGDAEKDAMTGDLVVVMEEGMEVVAGVGAGTIVVEEEEGEETRALRARGRRSIAVDMGIRLCLPNPGDETSSCIV